MKNTALNLIREFPNNWDEVINIINWTDYSMINFSNFNAGTFSVTPLQLVILEQETKFLHHFRQSNTWGNVTKNINYTDILNTWKIIIKTKNYQALDTLIDCNLLPYEDDFEELIKCMASSFYKYEYKNFNEEDYQKIYDCLKKYSKKNNVIFSSKNSKYYKKKRDNLCSNLLQTNNFDLFYFLFKNKELSKNNIDLKDTIKNINNFSNDTYQTLFNVVDFPQNHHNFWSNFYWIFKQKTNSSTTYENLLTVFDSLQKREMDKNFEAFSHIVLKENLIDINNFQVLFLNIFNKNKKNINLFKKLNYQILPHTWKTACSIIVQEKQYKGLTHEQAQKILNDICNNFIVPNFKSYTHEDKIKILLDEEYIKFYDSRNIYLKIYQAFLKTLKNKINLDFFVNELNSLNSSEKIIYLEKMALDQKSTNLVSKKNIL